MSAAVTSKGGSRSGRLPRWTRQEILALVEAKRAYERRCMFGQERPGEPKWRFVSLQCRQRGMERGPLQCRKRWSNLACDFKKIRAWEEKPSKCSSKDRGNDVSESYWSMRSDVRRERKLPGGFDREVFELMDAEVKEEEEKEVVFDSGRSARDDGLFSEFEEEEEEEAEEGSETLGEHMVVVPISERRYLPSNEHSDPGDLNDNKQRAENNHEKGSSSWEGQKRRRRMSEDAVPRETSLESKLIEVLEKNSRTLSAQLEAQNCNCQLDRDQRKDQTDGLVAVMSKIADALGRIADKL